MCVCLHRHAHTGVHICACSLSTSDKDARIYLRLRINSWYFVSVSDLLLFNGGGKTTIWLVHRWDAKCLCKGELLNFMFHVSIQQTDICVTKAAAAPASFPISLSMFCLKTDASFPMQITKECARLFILLWQERRVLFYGVGRAFLNNKFKETGDKFSTRRKSQKEAIWLQTSKLKHTHTDARTFQVGFWCAFLRCVKTSP